MSADDPLLPGELVTCGLEPYSTLWNTGNGYDKNVVPVGNLWKGQAAMVLQAEDVFKGIDAPLERIDAPLETGYVLLLAPEGIGWAFVPWLVRVA